MRNRFFILVAILSLGVSCMAQSASGTEIRKVDFNNFTYRWPKGLRDGQAHFTLKGGEVAVVRNKRGQVANIGVVLESTKYADLTEDGSEEAIIFVSLVTGGSSIPGILYVYSMHKGKPVMIFAKVTGDRADGGYRNAYERDGKLVVELANPTGSNGDCCPVRFDRLVYWWHLGDFEMVEKTTQPILKTK